MFLPNSDHEWPSKRSGTSACRSVKKCREKYLLQINISKYFIGKNKQNFVFFVSFSFRFFFFLSTSLTLISRSRRLFSPPYPSHLLCFVSLCWVPRSIYIFGIECQTTLQVQDELISRLPVEIYVYILCYCCGRILGNIGALQKY